MKVGFTGTREGMTVAQQTAFAAWVGANRDEIEEFHHGCCVGADEYAGAQAYDWLHCGRVVGHPGDTKSLTSNRAKAYCHEIRDPLPCLERNTIIVNACDVLIACPKGPGERRSGTWFTVRFARSCGKRIVIVWPDGKVTEEPATADEIPF